MKTILLIAVFLLIVGCSYEEYNIVNNNYNQQPIATDKFTTWLTGEFKPVHLPEANNMVCTERKIYIDLTGFLYDYTLTFENSQVEQTESYVKITYQDVVFTFWRTSSTDIRVDVIYSDTLFELGYFEKL